VPVYEVAHKSLDKRKRRILYLVISFIVRTNTPNTMAVKAIFQNNEQKKQKKVRAKDSGMKPLAKHFLDEHSEKEGSSHFVFQARVTPKGFLLILCKEFTLMYPAGMEEASTLLDEIFPKLHGKKGYRLVVILSKSNRFGGFLGTDDEHSCYYSYDESEEVLITSTEPITTTKGASTKKLSLEDFGTLT
jgi:hypothetical protein